MSVPSMSMVRMNNEKIIFTVVATCLVLVHGAEVRGRAFTDFEIRTWQVKHLNMPAVKSIKSEDGDIFDCVDIYKQPAFDHPLLKNHTIQVKPSNYESEKKNFSEPTAQLSQTSESCPEGTIPIMRTRSDLRKKISLEENSVAGAMESAKLYVDMKNHGGKANINVWNIHVEDGELSTASMFVGIKQRDFINAGWIVSPKVLGDNNTRLYIFWAANGRGCYNLQCPGFIQTNNNIYLGARISPLSTYNGNQYYIYVNIYKDRNNDNWWFNFGDQPVGYWPASLFSNMKAWADLVQWGGQVWNSKPGGRHTSTQMGSGHFASERKRKAAYFDKCFYLDTENVEWGAHHFPKGSTNPSCYSIEQLSFVDAGFFYGGPGGANCEN